MSPHDDTRAGAAPGSERFEPTDRSLWRGMEGAAALLVLGFFLFAVRGVLNPFLLFLVLWAVLLPFRGRPGHMGLLVTAGLLTLFWMLKATGSLLAPFVLAVVLAYLLDPLVDVLERRRLPRALAIVALTLPALGLLAALLLLAIPAAVDQLAVVAQRIPVFFQRIADWVEAAQERLLRVDLPILDEQQLVARLRSVDSAAVVAFLEARRAALAQQLWTGVLGLGRGVGSVLSVVGYGVLTPALTFYLLRDWDEIVRGAGELVPKPRREGVVTFFREYDRLLGRYLRGQITVAVAIGAITGVGLWLVRFPYAGTLGLLVAVFSVVPYLGLILSLIPALFIALVSGSVGVSLLKVAVVYGVAQGLEGSVISPRVVGDSVGLHPVWVVLALALGGFFFGFVGLLIGVPGAVGVKLLVERALARYKASTAYLGPATDPTTRTR
jgi:predicted PurR-regulated permease PerM